MSKKLRNLALLGGLGAAAAMAMRGKGKDEESKDTTGDASAGMAKDRLSDFRGKSGDVNKDIGPAVKRAAAPAAKPAAPAAKPVRPTPKVAAPVAKSRTEGLPGSSFGLEIGEGAAERESTLRRPTNRNVPLGQVSDIVGAKKGGMIGSASKRADGIAMKGKTKGRMV